jgi:hypothetical protein
MTARARATAARSAAAAANAQAGDAEETAVTRLVESPEHRNEVIIAGRLAAAAMAKQLPSGDEIVT